MNSHNVEKKLNIFNISLNDINLIEASAGTGKTFTIVILYLRLLLGVGNNLINKKKLLINEILVVTFTNAAKEELYTRIKNEIDNLYLACINKKSNNLFNKLFLEEIQDINEAIDVLKKAQNNINHSSIYTIHSFCQKMLTTYNLNYHSVFENQIVENEDDLYLQGTQDFWRSCLYNLPKNIINIIYHNYNSPECLLKKIKPFFYLKSINLKSKIYNNETLILNHEKNILKINNFKKIWLNYFQSILTILHSLKINKKIYNNINVSRWIYDITKWSESETKDYTIPIVLKYFTKKNIEKNTINKISVPYIIFEESEKLLKNKFSLKNIVIFYAIQKIKKFLIKAKKKSLLGFDDLLKILLQTIKKEKNLKNLIRTKYPAAFIDEFQDTDIEQYKIFDMIYKKHEKIALFLIGDPKQAIYSFRGADIFSYLYAKSKIKKRFYLDTNWRSSVSMCKSINLLFSQNTNPFLLKNISFKPIIHSDTNCKINFTINGVTQVPITFFLKDEKEVRFDDYQTWIAKQCANEISYWLICAKMKQAKIITKDGEKILTHNDITVLVRNGKEAQLIKEELNKLNIISTYSSNKNSIFQTSDAQELLWILKSILEPDNTALLQQSISTHILNTLSSIQKNLTNQSTYFLIEKLYEYHDIWKKIGIFPMVKTMILEYQRNARSIEINHNYTKNLNFLHIAELLQEEFQRFNKRRSLIRWFEKKISQKKICSHNEHIRSFNDVLSVQIVTIHKSKGLEYSIVWIPFGIHFNQSKSYIYHNQKNFKIFFNIEENNEQFNIANKERLAEDVRFLYVALTRSVIHCSIGIACIMKKKIKNTNNNSDIHHSALGYIIQNGRPMNYEDLFNQLNKLTIDNLIDIKHKTNKFILPIKKKTIYLIPESIFIKKNIKHNWAMTSFTQLNKTNKILKDNEKKVIFENLLDTQDKTRQELTIHNFPIGKQTGLLMHNILKNLNFLNKKKYNWFSTFLENYNLPVKWTPILISWIHNIINAPLNNGITLSQIKEQSCIQELEFFLPIKKILHSTIFNKIVQSIDPISLVAPKLFFNPVKGIIKGFIDLVFYYKKKYYIVDYKSNWLGKNNSFYSDQHIQKEIIKQRYDFQYQIYTLAINQYLQKKIKNYNYTKHFGGVFYIFLRALDETKENNGIFYTVPDHSLIKNLVMLIS